MKKAFQPFMFHTFISGLDMTMKRTCEVDDRPIETSTTAIQNERKKDREYNEN